MITASTLFYGDNLEILRAKVRDESVDLCYIDPPFNSKRTYNQIYTNVGQEDLAQAQAFVDTWVWDDIAKEGYNQVLSNHEGRFSSQTVDLIVGLRNVLKEGSLLAYLVSMTLRFVEIQRVLKPTGSFYLHCDATSSHYLKLVLDGVFCSQGGDFQNETTWQRTGAHNDAKRWGRVADTLLFYTKSDKWTWNQQCAPYSDEYIAERYKYTDKETGGRLHWRNTMTAAGQGPPRIFRDAKRNPPSGTHWRYSQEEIDRMEREKRIYYSPSGMPYVKSFLDERKGRPIQNIWTDIVMSKSGAERLGYPTQKPEALLSRVIKASTNEGDTILDCYCGCGTTIAVAQRLNRRWIGVDITYQSISLVLKRLERDFGAVVVQAVVLNGVPRDMKSAVALAHKKDGRSRKEFEKWAILTYTANRGIINEKKGGDKGIDGIAYILTAESEAEKMLLQVKSGGTGRGDVAKLRGDMEREASRMGVLITLEEPTKGMMTEAKAAGIFTNPLTGRTVDRIKVVTVKQIIENKLTLDLPVSLDAFWKARESAKSAQLPLFVPVKEKSHRKPAQSDTSPVEAKRLRSE